VKGVSIETPETPLDPPLVDVLQTSELLKSFHGRIFGSQFLIFDIGNFFHGKILILYCPIGS